jgi:hypothetical protein
MRTALSAARVGALALALGSATLHSAEASLALDVAPGGSQVPCGVNCGTVSGRTFGYSFTLSAPVTIDGLGMWDSASDGIGVSAGVGLWTDTGTLLASVTVTDASDPVASASAAGRWLFEDIAPQVLAAGTYRIGSVFFDPAPIANIGAFTAIAEMTLGTPARSGTSNTGLAVPTDIFNSYVFGANMRLEDAIVPAPEPASLALLAFGLAGLVAARRRRA